MKELFRTNNPVYLSFAQAVLKDAGIEALIFDGHMSVLEGSIGALPRRMMVPDEDEATARRLLEEADPPTPEGSP